MSVDSRVLELLERWEEVREKGQAITPEELCAGCPELLPTFSRHIADLEELGRLVETSQEDDGSHSPKPTGGEGVLSITRVSSPEPGRPSGELPSGIRYRPLRSHGKGGQGEVLVAFDGELNREVALKRMQARQAGHAESRRRFLMEAEITARLEHPGVVPVHGMVHDSNGQPCYAMRLIQGETLREAIERFHAADQPGRDPGERTLALRQLLGRFIAVCNTVAYAHSRGIIHRDLKPANILLGRYGETLVVDWGLARPFARTDVERATGEETLAPAAPADEGGTQLGLAVGTPAYMSPEQAAGRWDVIGPASDVYSLGATLYVLLTGKAPVSGSSTPEILQRVQRGEVLRPRQIKRDVSPALEAICLKAMAWQPEQRHGNALELAADLEHWLADEPVNAYREPWTGKTLRWARKHRAAVASGVVALLLLGASALSGLFLWESAEHKRRQQVEQHLSDLRHVAEAQEQLGLGELQAGRLVSAAKILGEAVKPLEAEPTLADLSQRIESRADSARRLVEADRLSARAERRLINNMDWLAIADFEASLTQLRVFDSTDWWDHIPPEVTEIQRQRLKRDVHHRLLILAALHARKGLMNLGKAGIAQAGCRAALLVVEAAQRYQRCATGDFIERYCRTMLGQKSDGPLLQYGEPQAAVDFYFVGILHYWLHWLPDDPMTRIALGQVQGLDLKTPLATAERLLRTASSLDSEHYWTYFWLGLTLDGAGKHSEAELAFSTCIGLRPDLVHGYTRAFSVLRQTSKEDDDRRKEALYRRALADFDRAIQIAPGDWRPLNGRGAGYLRMGNYQKAIDDFTAAIECGPEPGIDDPEFYDCYFSRGFAYRRVGKHDEAVADFTQAIALFPRQIELHLYDLSEVYDLRGLSQHARGRLNAAIADFGQAIKLREKAIYYVHRGDSHAAASDLPQAAKDYSAAMRLLPRNVEDLRWLADAFARANQHEKAATVLGAAIRLFPENGSRKELAELLNELAATFVNLATLCNQRRNFAGAKAYLQEAEPHHQAALKANPRNPSYRQFYRNNLRTLVFANAGLLDQAGAVGAAEKIRDLGWNPPGDAYDAVCALALCIPIVEKDDKMATVKRQAAIQFYGDQAMAMLRDAAAKGYKDVAHLKKDSDLDALRQRDDFSELLAKLEAKANPPLELLRPKEVPAKK